ncbi:MAG TPA: hypothetical protein P5120_07280 [Spirochaetota bacterium]|nr:hypothetical protein [Spirochaetota bacterium]HPF05779.1 hypothetical protein [Spirochaetota bacterium]HPJ42474.1 hypothetical protein [Spirochaetota bacterium]HPR37407.1 hypothetical protein [Spirochaetota bacterium]HRX47304.1 hypothetical protein [Spirochaetota bacterium]
MKKLNSKQIRILKIIHIFFFVSWIGGGIGLISLMFLAQPLIPDDIYMKYRSMQVIDDFIIIPGALGSLFTGLIYSIWTNWGFFRQRWLTVKWILTVAQILFGTFALGPWLNGNVDIAMKLRGSALTDSAFINSSSNIKLWGTLQVLFLLFMVIVSVIRPWKKTSVRKQE